MLDSRIKHFFNDRKVRLTLALVLILAVNIAVIIFAQNASAAIYRQGSRGEAVRDIQKVLQRTGHYKGSIDGIYGSQTTAAVKAFQRSVGISVDGICGPVTLKYLGLQHHSGGGGSSASYNNNYYLLARIISAEARGEPYKGQVAVGAVIMNRIRHPSFPNTLSGVIYQPGAFTAIVDGQFNEPVAESAYRAATDALNGWDPTGGCIYYFNPSTATSKWIWSRPQVMRLGKHIFCK
ncbi:MAG: spore cortex-lytic enzyme [Clostridiales bacterium]|jgi:N-acetylmuramoyl-L-alanine amidase|nr:spore cortex-lytic enzyme [Clostridiales bacterium]